MAVSKTHYEVTVNALGVRFLECKFFIERMPVVCRDVTCCGSCHIIPGHFIFVRPLNPDGLNSDFLLGIEAMICCKLYDLVRAVPRAVWVQWAEEFGTIRQDVSVSTKGYTFSHSVDKNTSQGAMSGAAKSKAVSKPAARRKGIVEEEAEGFGAFLNRFK